MPITVTVKSGVFSGGIKTNCMRIVIVLQEIMVVINISGIRIIIFQVERQADVVLGIARSVGTVGDTCNGT